MEHAMPNPLTPGDDIEQQWKTSKWRFQGYVELDQHRSKWTSEKQAKALIQLMMPECAYLHSDADDDTLKDVKKLTEHIDESLPKNNECFERFRYRQLVRHPTEDVNKFVSKCKESLAKCGLPAPAVDLFVIDTLVHNLQVNHHDQHNIHVYQHNREL